MTLAATQHDALFSELQALLERVKPRLRPVTAADVQERLWRLRERLLHLARASEPPLPPFLASPGGLPQPLNPFYFARIRKPR